MILKLRRILFYFVIIYNIINFLELDIKNININELKTNLNTKPNMYSDILIDERQNKAYLNVKNKNATYRIISEKLLKILPNQTMILKFHIKKITIFIKKYMVYYYQ
jgi:hypothetical protein